jgi:large subunit ribosomal protein L31
MKAQIHPQYFDDAKVTCACGNSFVTGATVAEIKVDVCHKCHPFFTGEMKYVDTLGRVEKFQKSQHKAKVFKEQVVKKLVEREQKARPSSLREMFELAKKQASS